jgi:hypothetical protein
MKLKFAGIFALLLFPAVILSAQSSLLREEGILASASFHENVEVRSAMADSIRAPFYSLLTRQKEIHSQLLSPPAVEFELRKSESSFYLLFKNELDYKYPVWGRGNYIIKRDLRTGAFLQIKIFLQNDEMSYIRLYPLDDKRTTLELTLYGQTLYDGIVLPVSLEELSVTSFARILFLTRDSIRWERILTDASYPEWRATAALAAALDRDLAYLKESDDGALSADGRFILIEDGSESGVEGGVNCSGFAKWLADGILLGRGRSLLTVEELKLPTDENRDDNPWSSARPDRDPWFGLDWCRNIAAALRTAEPGGRIGKPSDTDVRDVPFYTYRENLGYELENLKTLLYLLAVHDPGAVYLGAVNSPFGKDPVLWQYHHVALFFPWFDGNGDFHLEVMETGERSSLENLKFRYPDSFVHLSRVRVPSLFVSPREPE